jgi:uncharacterized membrane protein YqjE
VSHSAQEGVHEASGATAPGAAPTDPGKEPSIGELVGKMSSQVTGLVKGEIALAKAEASAKISKIAGGGVLLAVAGVLALYGLGLAFLTIIWSINEALPLWLSALIVTGGVFRVVAILALAGIATLKKHKKFNVAPQEGLKETADALKKGLGK